MPDKGKDFIIPVFIPHAGCPNHCVFCNQNTVTGEKKGIPSQEELHNIIGTFLNYKGKKRDKVQIGFYGGNFLGLKTETINKLLSVATMYVKNGSVDSIRFSTRPDTIDDYKLDIIKDFPVSAIELGVQSMDDYVLEAAKRGHTSSDTIKAVSLIKKRNLKTGLQMMVGLPGDDETRSLYTAHRISELSPDFVRIYPTVVLAESPLAVLYQKGKFEPLSLEQGVSITKKIYLVFKKNNIKVIRMGLQATEDLREGTSVLAGPYHPAFGHLVYSEIFFDNMASFLESMSLSSKDITIKVHPRSIPQLRGLKNINIKRIKSLFEIESLSMIPDVSLGYDEFNIRNS